MAKEPLSRSARERLASQRMDLVYKFGVQVVRWGAIVVIVWLLGDAIGDLAGKDTSFSALLSVFADLKTGIAVMLFFSLFIWAIHERRLRQRTGESSQGRIRELEQRIMTLGGQLAGDVKRADKPRRQEAKHGC